MVVVVVVVVVVVEVVSTKCWTNCVVKIIFINPGHVYPPAPATPVSLALSYKLSFSECKQIGLLYILYILFPTNFTLLAWRLIRFSLFHHLPSSPSLPAPVSQTITMMNDRRRTFAYICLMMARTEYS